MQYNSEAQIAVRKMSKADKAAMMEQRIAAAISANLERTRRFQALHAERNTPEYKARMHAAAAHGCFSPEWEAFVRAEKAAELAAYGD